MSFSLTRKTDYALVALFKLAREWGLESKPLSARQIADDYHLPLPLLMNSLKDLHRAGILISRRGVGGGYGLSRQPNEISLREIIEALEGPINVTHCSDDPDCEDSLDLHNRLVDKAHAGQAVCNACQIYGTCPISTPIQRFNSMLNKFISSISLQDLVVSEPALVRDSVGV